MKRVLLAIFSIVLILACLFSLLRVVPGVQDVLNLADYKKVDEADARNGLYGYDDGTKDNVNMDSLCLVSGLSQLKENEQTYLDGVVTYVDGERQLAEGQALIDANTQAYNEGKELIGTMQSLMPTIESLAGSIQQVRDFNAGIIGGDLDSYLGKLRSDVLNTLANGQAVAALSEVVGMDISGILASNPTDTSILGNVVNMYYDGLAQLKQYEDGLAQLADGRAQLADGNAQLCQFEDGEAQIVDGIMTLMQGMKPSYHPYSHKQTVDSLPERLAAEFGIEVPELYNESCAAAKEDGFSYSACFNDEAYAQLCDAVIDALFQKDADGNYVSAKRDGKVLNLLDLDKCMVVVDKADEYLADSAADTYGEVIPRVVSYALVALACVFGIIAGLMGIIASITGGKKTGKGFGITSAIMAVGAFVAAILSHYTDLIYGVKVVAGTETYSIASSQDTSVVTDVIYRGNAQKPIFLVMVIAAILFVIFAAIAKKAAKKKASKKAVEAEASSAAVAGAADSERVSKLEAENAELKAMVAEMAANAATVKD